MDPVWPESGAWPTVYAVRQLLDVTGDDFEDELTALLAAAIAQVKADVGAWVDDTDTPDEALGQAALRAVVLLRPNSNDGLEALRSDRVYRGLLMGHRRTFGFA